MKTKYIFVLISFYVIASIVWWCYSLILIRYQEASERSNLLVNYAKVLEEYLNTPGMKGIPLDSLQSGLLKSTGLNGRNVFITRYQHNSVFVNPHPAELTKIKNNLSRKITQYVTEGITFLFIWFWGMIILYRNLQARIQMNRQQTNFMLSITHELKTPIAAIRLVLETIRKRNPDVEKRNLMIQDALQDTERLSRNIENILLANSLDFTGYPYHFEKFDLKDTLIETASYFNRITQKSHSIITNLSDTPLYIYADKQAIRVVIENLLSNAIKYSPLGSVITIQGGKNNNHIQVAVSDQAPLIPQDEIKKIFSRFYRMGNELTHTTKGSGLGLYIVRQIALKHNAVITVEPNKDNMGNCFTLTFEFSNG